MLAVVACAVACSGISVLGGFEGELFLELDGMLIGFFYGSLCGESFFNGAAEKKGILTCFLWPRICDICSGV